MKAVYLVCGLALTIALVGAAQAAEDCALKQVASLVMSDALPDRVVVDVTVAGKPRPFLVDTGGVYSTIYQDVSDALGLQTHAIDQNIEIYDLAGAKSKRYAFVPSLKIGELKADDIPLVVEPRDGDTVDGVLAPDFLSRFDLDFDIAGRKLNLVSPEHCQGKVIYWSDAFAEAPFTLSGVHIVVPMTLDGHEIAATLDTGSNQTHLSERIGRSVFNLGESSAGMERIPNASPDDLEQFRYRFSSLSLAGLTIKNPVIYLMPDRAAESFRSSHHDRLDIDPVHATHLQTADLLLGMNVLSKLHFYIAYREHKIYFTGAGAH
ncbi:MAG TPA: pepsin/retropepsin-like aspartic protease family protein [Rhizomicrobium sp.]|jgi:predicted aspartyl protease